MKIKQSFAHIVEHHFLWTKNVHLVISDLNSTTVDLILENCGSSHDEVCKKICEIFQIEPDTAKEYAEAVPVYLCQEISLSDAEYVKQQLESVGAILRIEYKD